MWEKRATSAEWKNYLNSRVLGNGQLGGCPLTMCKFWKCFKVWKENGDVSYMQLYRRAGMRLLEKRKTMKGYGREVQSFVFWKWKMFYATIPKGWYKVVGKWFDHEGLWSKKEEFWRNKQMVIFRENIYKRDFLPFSTKMYFREKVLKENSYKDRFMGKSSQSLLFFSIKI